MAFLTINNNSVIKGFKTGKYIHFEIIDKEKDVICGFTDIASNYKPVNLFKMTKEERDKLIIYE